MYITCERISAQLLYRRLQDCLASVVCELRGFRSCEISVHCQRPLLSFLSLPRQQVKATPHLAETRRDAAGVEGRF